MRSESERGKRWNDLERKKREIEVSLEIKRTGK